MRPAQLDRTGKECPATQGPRHWTKRTPERLTWRGERNGSAKLTTKCVECIRADTILTNARLATIYQVHPNTIGKVRRRETWKHL